MDEAVATLRDEPAHLESWLLLSLDGKDYLLAYSRMPSLEASQTTVGTSSHEIVAFHRKFERDTWAGGMGA